MKGDLVKSQKGFTLIELLVVVAILAVLAAIAIPNVSKFIGRGQVEASNTELHMIGTSVVAYQVDNNGTIPVNTANITSYITGSLKGTYTIDQTSGEVTGVTSGYDNVIWDTILKLWKKK